MLRLLVEGIDKMLYFFFRGRMCEVYKMFFILEEMFQYIIDF